MLFPSFYYSLYSLVAFSRAQSASSRTNRPTGPNPSTAPEDSPVVVSGPGRSGGKLNGNFPFGSDPGFAATFIPASTVVIEPSPTLRPGSTLTCKTVVGDSLWPDFGLWTSSLPGVQPVPYVGIEAHPNYFLAATSIGDVQRAVNFTREYNIRLSVVSSGLDYLGRSDAPNGLLLSVKRLKGVQVLPNFQPANSGAKLVNFQADPSLANIVKGQASSNFAVSVGAGVTTQELNDALEPSNLFTMGPAGGSIAVAGGWSQGAGHGPLTGYYGLGADNVLEYQVVTADGRLRIANAASNSDLFWSLRGGGGGTFGVVVQATLRAYPSPRIAVSSLWLNSSISADSKIYSAAAYLHSQIPSLKSLGIQGYYFVYPSAIQGIFIAQDRIGADMKRMLETTFSRLRGLPGNVSLIAEHDSYSNYKEFYDHSFGMLNEAAYDILDRCRKPLEFLPTSQECQNITRSPGLRRRSLIDVSLFARQELPLNDILDPTPSGRTTLDSQLLADVHLADPQLSTAIEESMPRGEDGKILTAVSLRTYFTLGGGVRSQSSSSYHPAWRRASALIVSYNVSSIRAISNDMASSLDEGYWNATNWKSAFFGANHDRLHRTKLKYDPRHLFFATPGIGADAWVVDASRLCRRGTPDTPLVEHWGNNTVPLGDNQNPVRSREFPSFATPWPSQQAAADAQAAARRQHLKDLRDVSSRWRQSPGLQSATAPSLTPMPLPDWIPNTTMSPGVQFTPIPGDTVYT